MTMVRLIAILLVAAAVSGYAPTQAAEARRTTAAGMRREVARYEAPASFGIDEPTYTRACTTDMPKACVEFPVGFNEKFVSISISDASGLPVPAFVQPHDDSGRGVQICGKSEQPIRIIPGLEIVVWLNSHSLRSPCPGAPSTGTVEAVFRTSRKAT